MPEFLRGEQLKTYLGKTVEIHIDRPIGYVHKKEKYSLVYPINYGYIPGVLGGDGEELDVYLLGLDKPVEVYKAKIIAIVYRQNDVEDKLVAAPENYSFTKEEIEKAISFQEQYYDSEVEVLL
ncbi:MAG: inorganic diphosphatase [Clostridia bacterium]|nr:inorganic diphosphatase [Clostridia bacterium]MBR6620237.1 inorganic diphosphatase [Clostridia bacterium]